jgi:predicted acetyltransferase
MDQIRNLKQEELSESMALSEFAFQFELSEEARKERISWINPDRVWGYFVDGQLAAKLTVLEFQTWLHGKSFAMGGVAGVATWPEFRRKGMVGQLLRHALKAMKDAGETVSFLYPFEFSFYRKYGWETYVHLLKYEIPTELLPRFDIEEAAKMERISSKDWKLLSGIYEDYAKRYNGMLIRNEEWWTNRYFKLKKGNAVTYRNAQRELTGYIYYQVMDKIFTVHELVFLDEEARRGLWKFIADHDSMIQKVILQAPSDDKLPFLLSNPRIKQEIVPYFMARIVDVEDFMGEYPFTNAGDGKPLFIKVSDQHAEWNNGLFEIHINDAGEAKVLKHSDLKDSDQGTAQLTCDIQTLSACLMGYQQATFLHQIGRIQGDAADVLRLEKLIPERSTYLADFF